MIQTRLWPPVVLACTLILVGAYSDAVAKTGFGLKRASWTKPTATRVHAGLVSGAVLVKFKDDIGISSRDGRLYHADDRPVSAVNSLIDKGRVARAAPEFEFDKSTLRTWRKRGEQLAGIPLSDLGSYFRLTLSSDQTLDDAARIADLLNRSLDVELAFLEGRPEVAGDISPATPDFEPQQAYLKTAPGGVDAYTSWTYPGGKGEGVTICDIEFGWHTGHEDLTKLVGNIIGGDPGPSDHGTAVMGEMVADSTVSSLTSIGYGVTGIAFGAGAKMVSVSYRSTASALLLAAENLSPGDIILIELHQAGPNSCTNCGQLGYVPMEWTPSVFDAIQTITANGIIVCEAAGNGSQNLDAAIYGDWFDTTYQHSGAIMCGAGAPPSGVYGPDRSRLDFSNYGMRVDLQGYGRGVVTTGYGGLFDPGDANQWYTATFSGTSSASPIVTASVACVQGRYKYLSGGYTLHAKEIRDLLYATGSPQTGTTSQHIGPRPNLGAAVPLVAPRSAYARPGAFNVSLLESPIVTDTLWLVNPHATAATFAVSMVDSLPVPAEATSLSASDPKAGLRSRSIAATTAVSWITLSLQSGTIPALDSLPIELTFDGTVLEASYFGSYYKARIDVEVDGALGVDTVPVSVLAIAQDAMHGDTVDVVTAEVTFRATSETNLQGWDYNDLSTAGWLYDGSFVIGRVAGGDTTVYRDIFGNARMWRGRDEWQVDSSWLPRYLILRDSSMTEDSLFGLGYDVWVPVSGDSADFVFWRTRLYARQAPLENVYLGLVADWDLPSSSGAANFGGYDSDLHLVYQTGNAGYENEAAGFAVLDRQAHGAVAGSNSADVYPTGGFQDGRLYRQLRLPFYRIDASNVDLHLIMTAAYVPLLDVSEPVVSEVVMLSSRDGVTGLGEALARAQQISDSLRFLRCPIEVTGDVNTDHQLTSADIIYLVNFVFKSGPEPLPIRLAGDADCSEQVTSSDIIYMVNHLFKSGATPCDACIHY